MAAEFQGFCRELHHEAAEQLSEWAAPANEPLERAIVAAITSDRQLDRANAHKDSLARDFAQVGIGDLWKALDARDGRTPARREQLERLNRARNAIAHAKDGPLADLAKEGYRLKLGTFRRWRSALDSLAATMDGELAETIGRLFRRAPPW